MTRFIPVALLLAIVAVGCDDTRSVGERTYYNGNGSVTRVEGQYDPGTGSTTYHTERYGSVGQFNQAKPAIDAAHNQEAIGKFLKEVLWGAAKKR